MISLRRGWLVTAIAIILIYILFIICRSLNLAEVSKSSSYLQSKWESSYGLEDGATLISLKPLSDDAEEADSIQTEQNKGITPFIVIAIAFSRYEMQRLANWLPLLDSYTACPLPSTPRKSPTDFLFVYLDDSYGKERGVLPLIEANLRNIIKESQLFSRCLLTPLFLSLYSPANNAYIALKSLKKILKQRYKALLLVKAQLLPLRRGWLGALGGAAALPSRCSHWTVRAPHCADPHYNRLYALDCQAEEGEKEEQWGFVHCPPPLSSNHTAGMEREGESHPTDRYLLSSASIFMNKDVQLVLSTAQRALGREVTRRESRDLLLSLLPKLYSFELSPSSLAALFTHLPSRPDFSLLLPQRLRALQEGAGHWAALSPLYLWSADFHAGPVVCQMPIFRDLGIAVHVEVDYKNCRYAGYCKERLRVLGYDKWRGFALETGGQTPEQIKERFFQAYKDDAEMQRVDGFLCSHPAANCQLFTRFNKSLIVFFTTRMEFGRHDAGLGWRLKSWTPAKGQREWALWLRDLVQISQGERNVILANNHYDAQYVKYFTGLEVETLSSWCGDVNYVYDEARREEFFDFEPPPSYMPIFNQFLVGPYRTNVHAPRRGKRLPLEASPIVLELRAKEREMNRNASLPYLSPLQFLFQAFPKGYRYRDLTQYRGMVLLPYQVSTISILEYYRLNLPLFAPSLSLLLSWHQQRDVMWERVYGWPECSPSLLPDFPGRERACPTQVPNPNGETEEGLRAWLSLSDFYTLPFVSLFDSVEDLLRQLRERDGWEVSRAMRRHNEGERQRMLKRWGEILQRVRRR